MFGRGGCRRGQANVVSHAVWLQGTALGKMCQRLWQRRWRPTRPSHSQFRHKPTLDPCVVMSLHRSTIVYFHKQSGRDLLAIRSSRLCQPAQGSRDRAAQGLRMCHLSDGRLAMDQLNGYEIAGVAIKVRLSNQTPSAGESGRDSALDDTQGGGGDLERNVASTPR